jgi:hypothetical protein
MNFEVLKMFLHVLAQFEGVNEMKNFLESNQQQKCVFDFDLSQKDDPMHNKNMILTALSIAENSKLNSEQQMAVIEKQHEFIDKHPKLSEMWRSKKNEKYLDKFLMKLLSIWLEGRLSYLDSKLEMNFEDEDQDLDNYYKSILKNGLARKNRVGNRIDPYYSLLNHSCIPSIAVKFVDNKYAWVVKHPLSAGDQIFACYLQYPLLELSKQERQESLQRNYRFECDCVACANDWPCRDEVKHLYEIDGYQSIRLSTDFEQTGNKLVDIFTHCNKMTNAAWNFFPNIEVLFAIETTITLACDLALPAPWFSGESQD